MSWAQSTIGSLFQKSVYRSFSLKIVLNCIHIWSVDLFLVKDKVPARKLIKIAALAVFQILLPGTFDLQVQWGHVWGVNHVSSMELFLCLEWLKYYLLWSLLWGFWALGQMSKYFVGKTDSKHTWCSILFWKQLKLSNDATKDNDQPKQATWNNFGSLLWVGLLTKFVQITVSPIGIFFVTDKIKLDLLIAWKICTKFWDITGSVWMYSSR